MFKAKCSDINKKKNTYKDEINVLNNKDCLVCSSSSFTALHFI